MQQNLTFAGTIAELIAEIQFMGNESWITKRSDGYLEIDLTVGLRKSPMQARIMPSANKKRGDVVWAAKRTRVPDAVATIRAVANGNRVDLIIDMETEQAHDRWEKLHAHLVSRGRLAQAPATTDRDPGPADPEWYQNLTLDERQRYDFLRPYKEAWESGEITDKELAEKAIRSVDTIRGWRRKLRKLGALDMEWNKSGV